MSDEMSDEAKPRIIGMNTRCYPTQIPGRNSWSANPPTVRVVLVAGDIEDYAAYCGIGSPEWVAQHGDKLSFAEACCHFPGGQLSEEKYRE